MGLSQAERIVVAALILAGAVVFSAILWTWDWCGPIVTQTRYWWLFTGIVAWAGAAFIVSVPPRRSFTKNE